MDKLKTIIVDDERLARSRLERLLRKEPDVELIGQCRSAHEAHALLARGAPDVMFLDIQMPRGSGFALLGELPPRARPAVIFVTAFEKYAVQAFEVRACDYLLKPVAAPRLALAVQRARDALRRPAGEDGGDAPLAAPGEPAPDAVLVRDGERVLRIAIAAIDWIEAAGNYVHLHVDRHAYLLRETLAAFEARLAPGRFARIHRTAIVNLDRVVEFCPTISGDFSVTLRTGAQLRMSRSYRGRIRDLFGKPI
jgi:two-component system, LytTR family, response regulator